MIIDTAGKIVSSYNNSLNWIHRITDYGGLQTKLRNTSS